MWGRRAGCPGRPRTLVRGAAEGPRVPRPGGSGGHRLAGAGETAGPGGGPDGGAAGRPPRSDPTPARSPRGVRGGARAGGRRRQRRLSSARPGLRWEEARRPGERKRGPDPPPAAPRLREGAGPARGGAWADGAAPPAGRRGHCGGCVRARALPPPARPRWRLPKVPRGGPARPPWSNRQAFPGVEATEARPRPLSSVLFVHRALTRRSIHSFTSISWRCQCDRPCSGVCPQGRLVAVKEFPAQTGQQTSARK